MSLSIAIATHNEENNIGSTLESIYDWADEIVVVDGTSTDKTVEVIKELDKDNKIQIFNEVHEAMFHKNKQIAIERCTKDWILQLDADEVVSKELREEIVEVLKTQNSNVKSQNYNSKLKSEELLNSSGQILNSSDKVAYWLPRLNYFLGKPLQKGGQYPDYTIRLYKNGVAHFPCKSIHENVTINQSNNRTIGHLKSDLLHYPYSTFGTYLEKWSRYALLEAEILKSKGVRPSFFNSIKYMVILPKWWFFWTYIRHKGFMDGFAGFTFSLFSALRYVVTYIRLYELKR